MVRASLHRVGQRIRRRNIDEMQEHPRALQMLQEANAETRPVGRSLDEPGYVRHDEAAAGTRGHHAKIRMQGGEGIIGHFGPCRRYRSDQGGLAGIGQAE